MTLLWNATANSTNSSQTICEDGLCPYFIDWLQNRVQIVQITAYADDDAYAIFETMNDRGLKLAPPTC